MIHMLQIECSFQSPAKLGLGSVIERLEHCMKQRQQAFHHHHHHHPDTFEPAECGVETMAERGTEFSEDRAPSNR
jgi:hypothetical protein